MDKLIDSPLSLIENLSAQSTGLDVHLDIDIEPFYVCFEKPNEKSYDRRFMGQVIKNFSQITQFLYYGNYIMTIPFPFLKEKNSLKVEKEYPIIKYLCKLINVKLNAEELDELNKIYCRLAIFHINAYEHEEEWANEVDTFTHFVPLKQEGIHILERQLYRYEPPIFNNIITFANLFIIDYVGCFGGKGLYHLYDHIRKITIQNYFRDESSQITQGYLITVYVSKNYMGKFRSIWSDVYVTNAYYGIESYILTPKNTNILTLENTNILTLKNTNVLTLENTNILTLKNTNILTLENTNILTLKNTNNLTLENTKVFEKGISNFSEVDQWLQDMIAHYEKIEVQNRNSRDFTKNNLKDTSFLEFMMPKIILQTKKQYIPNICNINRYTLKKYYKGELSEFLKEFQKYIRKFSINNRFPRPPDYLKFGKELEELSNYLLQQDNLGLQELLLHFLRYNLGEIQEYYLIDNIESIELHFSFYIQKPKGSLRNRRPITQPGFCVVYKIVSWDENTRSEIFILQNDGKICQIYNHLNNSDTENQEDVRVDPPVYVHLKNMTNGYPSYRLEKINNLAIYHQFIQKYQFKDMKLTDTDKHCHIWPKWFFIRNDINDFDKLKKGIRILILDSEYELLFQLIRFYLEKKYPVWVVALTIQKQVNNYFDQYEIILYYEPEFSDRADQITIDPIRNLVNIIYLDYNPDTDPGYIDKKITITKIDP